MIVPYYRPISSGESCALYKWTDEEFRKQFFSLLRARVLSMNKIDLRLRKDTKIAKAFALVIDDLPQHIRHHIFNHYMFYKD